MSSLRLDRLRSLCAAVLIGAVCFAPVRGFMHRIVHAGVFAATAVAEAAGSITDAMHACAALDAATLSAAPGSRLCHARPFPACRATPSTPIHVPPLLPLLVQFRSRAPPAADETRS